MSTDALYERFLNVINRLSLHPGQQIVAALGGGADSQTILDLLMRFRRHNPQYNYLAIHLDHSFHPDSGRWSDVIHEAAKAYGVDTIFEPLEVPMKTRVSKEAIGRELRYKRLAELTESNAVLLLGQHKNDQIETFLLQLKRGSGPKGLASMAEIQPWEGERTICRPLLSTSKEEIVGYAQSNQLTWIEDDTNYDTTIERNFLRHDVIPTLEKRWPHFGMSVIRAARLCAEQQDVMNELLLEKLQVAQQEKCSDCFPLNILEDASAAMQRALLRTWLQTLGKSLPSYEQLEQIRRQSLNVRSDSQLEINCQGYWVRYFQNALWVDDGAPEAISEVTISKPVTNFGEWGSLRVPESLLAESERLTISCIHPKSRLGKPGRNGRKKLIDWLKERGLAPWLRQRMPVLQSGDHFIWTPVTGWLSTDPESHKPPALIPSWETSLQWLND